MNKQHPNKSSQIPEGGTLGILAYGYKSIMLWRQERQRILEERIRVAQAKNKKNEEK